MRVCKMNGFKADYSFAIKAYLKIKPFSVLTALLMVSVGFFAYGA